MRALRPHHCPGGAATLPRSHRGRCHTDRQPGARSARHVAAVAELFHVLLIAAEVILGLGAAAPVGLLAWRWRRSDSDAARAMPPLPRKMAQAAQPLPEARPARVLPAEPHRELPAGLRLHLHGVTAEDIAEIIARRDRPP
jgi:hypothetical protein